MARLNDLTTSTESIEGLKRRFVRQNREIARVNSIQSLRIRSLESEVSQLLAENVSLREQAITLKQELKRCQATKLLQDGVYSIKSKLDAKLMELSTLVTELGELPRDYNKKQSSAQMTSSTPQSALSWERKIADMERTNTHEEEGRLPTILEDKYFPRKTLELHSIQGLLNSDHIDPESPAGLESATIHTNNLFPAKEEIAVNESLVTHMKRTDSQMVLQPTSDPGTEENEDDATKPQTRFAACEATTEQAHPQTEPGLGAKRKFSSAIEDKLECSVDDNDDFQYRQTRSPPGQGELMDSASGGRGSIKEDVHPLVESKKINKQARRRILKPKSSNTSVHSPRNASHELSDDMQEDLVMSALEVKGHTTSLVEATSCTPHGGGTPGGPLKHPTPGASCGGAGIANDKHELVNSVSLTQDRLEQPTPGTDIRGAVACGATGSSRPARRQRAIVSYAEPNLRDKMRRPTDELVAAVGDQKRRTSGTMKALRSTKEDEDACPRRRPDAVKSPTLNMTGTGSPTPVMNLTGDSPSKKLKMVSQRRRKASLASRYDLAMTYEEAQGGSECSDLMLTGVENNDHKLEAQDSATHLPDVGSDECFGTRLTEATDGNTSKTSLDAYGQQQRIARQANRRSTGRRTFNEATSKRGEAILADNESPRSGPDNSRVSPIKSHDFLELLDHERHATADIVRIPAAESVATETRQIGRSLRAAARRRSMML
ncbi:shugoshin family protein [Aspergillus saccharolyticus JOP 1030-1]|uniref:Shugoshin n=1 Tax=Aspergillus saccharolyticus JOP 1030-1 TaxID=1450539 RepID=A0A318ZUN1_9EURO|nr:hypothetical protein BP01DRAFT_195130 [Aspergillus saccharolyticus JOP 1030-1]PYH47700.1 hypothetical protein BP01DRAFT_195130 [Aspergillus saccharolyticus JOP 1030-1]